MSQYYHIRVGFVHDEDYHGWLELCRKLKSVGLLDDDAMAMQFDWEVDDDDPFCKIFEAVRNDDPNPERFILKP